MISSLENISSPDKEVNNSLGLGSGYLSISNIGLM